MATFNLRLKTWTNSVFDETIAVEVAIQEWKLLRKIIKDFLEANDLL